MQNIQHTTSLGLAICVLLHTCKCRPTKSHFALKSLAYANKGIDETDEMPNMQNMQDIPTWNHLLRVGCAQ